eukprot:COSAG01_NODE_56034_length_321_cov_0.680180_1_plen_37_part_10
MFPWPQAAENVELGLPSEEGAVEMLLLSAGLKAMSPL